MGTPKPATPDPQAFADSVEALQEAFLHGVAAVDPTRLVKAHVRTGALDDWLEDREHPRTLTVLALGKAAARMVWGLVEANVPFRGLGVHPGGVAVPQLDGFQWLRAEHPVPGDGSFAAGQAVWDRIGALPPDEPILVLLSGGASSLLERPCDGMEQDALRAAWKTDLRAGLPIEELNLRRARHSSLKAGGLAARAGHRPVRVWCLSDVPADRLDALGSGPFWNPTVNHTLLADNDRFVQAAGAALQARKVQVFRHGARIEADVEKETKRFVDAFLGLPQGPVALIGGGEPTLTPPQDAPPGGRGQHAALMVSRLLHEAGAAGTGTLFLTGASDGRDGTDAAMAIGDARLWSEHKLEAEAAVQGFDAARFLAAHDRIVSTGPTGTNVADLWVILRH